MNKLKGTTICTLARTSGYQGKKKHYDSIIYKGNPINQCKSSMYIYLNDPTPELGSSSRDFSEFLLPIVEAAAVNRMLNASPHESSTFILVRYCYWQVFMISLNEYTTNKCYWYPKKIQILCHHQLPEQCYIPRYIQNTYKCIRRQHGYKVEITLQMAYYTIGNEGHSKKWQNT